MGQSVLNWTGHQDYLCEGRFLCDTLCRWSSRPKQQGGSPFPPCLKEPLQPAHPLPRDGQPSRAAAQFQGPERLIHSDKQHSLVHLTSAQV